MNKRSAMLAGFVLLAALQLAVPGWMILGHERTLREGRVFKFRTRPVDPIDAFRGRYVWLALAPDTVKTANITQWRYNQKAFAVLGTGEDGFATVKRLEARRPADEPSAPVRTTWPDTQQGVVHISWQGLDRYYMTEGKAPAAEAAYRDHSRTTNHTCHVTVRVDDTQAVIENLFIENKPIRDWLREQK